MSQNLTSAAVVIGALRVKFCSMTLSSMICAALDGLSRAGSMCDSKKCRSLELTVLVGMPLGVDSYHGTGPRGNDNTNSRST